MTDAALAPVPTATWWARRWMEKAEPAERLAMRHLVAGQVLEDAMAWLRNAGLHASADDVAMYGLAQQLVAHLERE